MRRTSAVDIADRMEKKASLPSFCTIVASKWSSGKEKARLPDLESSISPSTTCHEFNEKSSNGMHQHDRANQDSEKESQLTRYEALRISLPLPPASTSLFSDKMELNSDEARELFETYMISQADKNALVSSDLDDKSNFYSAAAANIQQTAATIRSTLRQSLRRQKSTKGSVPISEVFQSVARPKDEDEETVTPEPIRRKSSNGSTRLPRPAGPYSPSPPLTPDMKTVTDHSEFVTIPLAEETTKISISPQEMEDTTSKKGTDRPEPTGNTSRRLSRSLSRKTRAQSVIDTDETIPVRLDIESMPSPALSPEASQVERRKLFEGDSDHLPRPVTANRNGRTEEILRTTRRKSYTSNTVGRFSGSTTITGKSSAAESLALASNPFADRIESKRANTAGRSTMAQKRISVSGTAQLRTMFDSDSTKSQVPSPTSSGSRSMLSELAGVLNKDTIMTLSSDMDKRISRNSMIAENPSVSASGNADTIRRVLQSTWNTNLKESDSMRSFMSSSDAAENLRQGISPPGSVNPRQLNQHLVSLSLKAQQTRRPEMPAGFMSTDDMMQEPEPTASFSSSTVRTMIPADEASELVTASKVQIQTQKDIESSKKISVSTTASMGVKTEGSRNNKEAFGTLRGSRRQQPRGSIPWAESTKTNDKTPAQRERDRYLQTLKG